jgi:hypothetical protein
MYSYSYYSYVITDAFPCHVANGLTLSSPWNICCIIYHHYFDSHSREANTCSSIRYRYRLVYLCSIPLSIVHNLPAVEYANKTRVLTRVSVQQTFFLFLERKELFCNSRYIIRIDEELHILLRFHSGRLRCRLQCWICSRCL